MEDENKEDSKLFIIKIDDVEFNAKLEKLKIKHDNK